MLVGTTGWLPLVLLAVPALICASSLGVGLANWLTTQLLSPQSLPRLDFEQGIPPDHRTLVAVPTMLANAAGIEHVLEGLEVVFIVIAVGAGRGPAGSGHRGAAPPRQRHPPL
jgi:hypothetical protein